MANKGTVPPAEPKLPTLRGVAEVMAERDAVARALAGARQRAVLADEAARQAQAYVDELTGRLAAFDWTLAGMPPAEEEPDEGTGAAAGPDTVGSS